MSASGCNPGCRCSLKQCRASGPALAPDWGTKKIWKIAAEVRRLMSRSRGLSAPRAFIVAAARLMPEACSVFSRSSAERREVSRCSRRLTVASCTRRIREISSRVRWSRNQADRRNRSSGGSRPRVSVSASRRRDNTSGDATGDGGAAGKSTAGSGVSRLVRR